MCVCVCFLLCLFLFVQNIEQIIEGAINFRPIDRFPCAGTGIPTVQGITGILQFYTQSPKRPPLGAAANIRPLYRAQQLLWFNLREEPLLYVCGKPFVLRDGDNPYVNIEVRNHPRLRPPGRACGSKQDLAGAASDSLCALLYMGVCACVLAVSQNTGINTRRLEAMERQLRRDLLAESERMRVSGSHAAGGLSTTGLGEDQASLSVSVGAGRALLHDEDSSGNLIAVWQLNVTKTSIQTPQQQFLRCFDEAARAHAAELAAESPRARARDDSESGGVDFTASYYRTPITDEQAPSPATLDDLIKFLDTARDSPRPVIVFNCQMGRGRTTTGLIIACLWCIHRNKVSPVWMEEAAAAAANAAAKTKIATPATPSRSILRTLSVQQLGTAAPSAASPAAAAAVAPTTSTSSTYMAPSSITGDDEQSVNKREDEFANGLKHGWFKLIQSLVRVLPDGPNIKKQVDRVIDQSDISLSHARIHRAAARCCPLLPLHRVCAAALSPAVFLTALCVLSQCVCSVAARSRICVRWCTRLKFCARRVCLASVLSSFVAA